MTSLIQSKKDKTNRRKKNKCGSRVQREGGSATKRGEKDTDHLSKKRGLRGTLELKKKKRERTKGLSWLDLSKRKKKNRRKEKKFPRRGTWRSLQGGKTTPRSDLLAFTRFGIDR